MGVMGSRSDNMKSWSSLRLEGQLKGIYDQDQEAGTRVKSHNKHGGILKNINGERNKPQPVYSACMSS